MLVLSRKCTETIHIGDNIVVTVLEISRNRVRLGIAAPPGIPVMRTELMVASSADVAIAHTATL